jgi:hypothetical protein
VGATINYILSDSLIFRTEAALPGRQTKTELSSELYHPEGLAIALSENPKLRSSYPYKRYIPEGNVEQSLSLSIVIPARDEEGCIGQTIAI